MNAHEKKALEILTITNEKEKVCYNHGLDGKPMPYGITEGKGLSEIFDFSNENPPQEVIGCLECVISILKSAYKRGLSEAKEKAPTSAATEHEGKH